MARITFDDYCEIKRVGDGYDEYDNPIQEVIYSGKCCYQEGGYSNAQRMFVRNPILFLPEVSVLVDANDDVEVTTKFGRKLTAVVARPREIELPITRDRITRVELKQATE
jgi:hypothetical protein